MRAMNNFRRLTLPTPKLSNQTSERGSSLVEWIHISPPSSLLSYLTVGVWWECGKRSCSTRRKRERERQIKLQLS